MCLQFQILKSRPNKLRAFDLITRMCWLETEHTTQTIQTGFRLNSEIIEKLRKLKNFIVTLLIVKNDPLIRILYENLICSKNLDA